MDPLSIATSVVSLLYEYTSYSLKVVLTLTPGEDHVDMHHYRHSDLRPIVQIQQRAAQPDRDSLRNVCNGRFSFSDPDFHLVAWQSSEVSLVETRRGSHPRQVFDWLRGTVQLPG
jgi:hypothetical protein